ncbi:S8 family serine peptidase, partial [Acinetobacter baumannii]
TELTEEELLFSLESALAEHANKFKVWNLSLGTDATCSLDEFSTLAVELDNLQEKYQVSFVISAGNYNALPLLDYPRSG